MSCPTFSAKNTYEILKRFFKFMKLQNSQYTFFKICLFSSKVIILKKCSFTFVQTFYLPQTLYLPFLWLLQIHVQRDVHSVSNTYVLSFNTVMIFQVCPKTQLSCQLIAQNPVACARLFKLIVNAFHKHLVGLKMNNTKGVARRDRKKGAFGYARAGYAIVEASGRGYLHLHEYFSVPSFTHITMKYHPKLSLSLVPWTLTQSCRKFHVMCVKRVIHIKVHLYHACTIYRFRLGSYT